VPSRPTIGESPQTPLRILRIWVLVFQPIAYICYDATVKRTTVFIPDELHEELRQEAFRKRVSMAELIRSRLERQRKRHTSQTSLQGDPLLRVAGICRGEPLTENIDETLYGI
jgi:hypothetical protein